MPRVSLTPLGKQLRCILANIRPTVGNATPKSALTRAQSSATHGVNSNDIPSSKRSAAQATPTRSLHRHESLFQSASEPTSNGIRYVPFGQRRVDRIGEALENKGQEEAAPTKPRNMEDKPDAAFVNMAERRISSNPSAHSAFRYVGHQDSPEKPRLPEVLARYIQHRAALSQTEESALVPPFQMDEAENGVLNNGGYDLQDLEAWADMVSCVDSLEAATKLESRITLAGAKSVPLFILLYILRKDFLTTHALRILIPQASAILDHRKSTNSHQHVPVNAVFIVFSRLLRHARQVWPAAIANLTSLLLAYLPKTHTKDDSFSPHHIELLTYQTNKALRLLAIPASIEPYKNNRYQEVAIVKILQFMSEHEPPLLINREGYRGVVLLQLAQPKTSKEQQWAELKALSWPPWKSERTAMDSDITVADHGTSKAAESLMRMREAGYSPHMWEKVAGVYTGWDTDGTPTVQTRVQLGTGDARFRSSNALWAARISTTRTIQEAWAAFLAYDEQKLRPRQDVYLAIFRKLHKEEQRQRMSRTKKSTEAQEERGSRLFAGDAQEMQPLPPSTHLYTYTRTPPPTMHDLYLQLRQRGAKFDGHCLAYLIANAASLQTGLIYLRDSLPADMFSSGDTPSHDLAQLPVPVFPALIKLLCRFSSVKFPHQRFPEFSEIPRHEYVSRIVEREPALMDHCFVRALELLTLRRLPYRATWNSVLEALAREQTFRGLRSMFNPRSCSEDISEHAVVNANSWRASIVASRFTIVVMNAMRGSRVEMDSAGFLNLCQVVENAAIRSWKLLDDHREHALLSHWDVQCALALVETQAANHLNTIFEGLIGHSITSGQDTVQQGLVADEQSKQYPKFFDIPSPAVLHRYIRALGWVADYDKLVDLVKWMVKHKDELAERRKRDQNGEIMMRRALVALRLFLERSWLPTSDKSRVEEPSSDIGLQAVYYQLKRLKTPASVEVVNDVINMVDSVDDWGGWPDTWPDDEEVEEYCAGSKFPQLR